MISVLVVDDEPLVRTYLGRILSSDPSIRVMGHAGSAPEALQVAHGSRADVVLLDVRLGPSSGTSVLPRLRALGLTVLMLSNYTDEVALRSSLRDGASGFLLKSTPPAALIRAVHLAGQGLSVLSPELSARLAGPLEPAPASELTTRERDVLHQVGLGRSNAAIAHALRVTVPTVKGHVSALLRKLGCTSRTQLALLARNGR